MLYNACLLVLPENLRLALEYVSSNLDRRIRLFRPGLLHPAPLCTGFVLAPKVTCPRRRAPVPPRRMVVRDRGRPVPGRWPGSRHGRRRCPAGWLFLTRPAGAGGGRGLNPGLLALLALLAHPRGHEGCRRLGRRHAGRSRGRWPGRHPAGQCSCRSLRAGSTFLKN